jgi:tetratricopeptide (TPR) repeat protein
MTTSAVDRRETLVAQAARLAGWRVFAIEAPSRRLATLRPWPVAPRGTAVFCVFGQVLLALAALAHPLRAELDAPQARAVFEEANQTFREAGETKDPRKAFGLYQSAALRYQRLLEEGGIRNEKLYYNLGNAYYRTGDLGRAILNYRRAQALAPADDNVRQNLEAARAARIDRFSEPTETRVLRTLLFWHFDLSFGARLALLACFSGAFWALAALRLFRPEKAPRPALAICGGLAAALLLSVCFEGWRVGDDAAGVVTANEAIARKGDGENYEQAFTEPLHSGAEVRVLERRGEWVHGELPDGRTFWLHSRDLEMVGDDS